MAFALIRNNYCEKQIWAVHKGYHAKRRDGHF